MVFKRHVESNIIKQEKCKIAVFTCPVDQVIRSKLSNDVHQN